MKTGFIFLLLVIATTAGAQTRGSRFIAASAGVSFSNLYEKEAPHKRDVDYKSHVLFDQLVRATPRVYGEYFVRDNLSINAGISFETKGTNLRYRSTRIVTDTTYWGYHYDTKIRNSYLVVPVSLKKYIFHNRSFFIEAGFYSALLVASRVNVFSDVAYFRANGERLLWKSYSIDGKDRNLEFTKKIDAGLPAGFGYVKDISNNWRFNGQIAINIGLTRIDAKYNNEYSEVRIPSGTNYSTLWITNTNYYGLSSDSKNVSATASFGMAYKL